MLCSYEYRFYHMERDMKNHLLIAPLKCPKVQFFFLINFVKLSHLVGSIKPVFILPNTSAWASGHKQLMVFLIRWTTHSLIAFSLGEGCMYSKKSSISSCNLFDEVYINTFAMKHHGRVIGKYPKSTIDSKDWWPHPYIPQLYCLPGFLHGIPPRELWKSSALPVLQPLPFQSCFIFPFVILVGEINGMKCGLSISILWLLQEDSFVSLHALSHGHI